MYSYLVDLNGEERIYCFDAVQGICEKTKISEKNVLKDATDKFFVYTAENTVKMIALNKKSQLVYMIYKEHKWNSYVISTVKKNIEIKKIMVATNGKNENLFYSANVNGEMVLVHCVLGNNAMPSVIAKLCDEEFFLFRKCVYYSDENNIIGYQSFQDSKPDRFIPCCEGESPYLVDKKIVYKKDNDIFVNNKKICSDKNVKMPILVNGLLMWRNESYIRYIAENSKIRQYISSGIEPQIFVRADENECLYYYGTFSNGKLNIFS